MPSTPVSAADQTADRLVDIAQRTVVDAAPNDAEISRAIREIGYLSTFFGRLATNDAAAAERASWEDLRHGYATAAGKLLRLRDAGAISTASLPAGTRAEVRGNRIVLDRTLDGDWDKQSLEAARRAGRDDWIFSSRLSSRLIEALAQLEGYQGWAWFDAHAARSGVGQTPTAAPSGELWPLLVRYWYLQDRFLWASIAVGAADEARVRDAWKGRSLLLAGEMTALLSEIKSRLGNAWEKRLGDAWIAYRARTAEIGEAFSGGPLLSAEVVTPDAVAPAARQASPTPEAEKGDGRALELAAVEKRIADLEGQLVRLGSELLASREETRKLEGDLAAARSDVAAQAPAEDPLTRSTGDPEPTRTRDQQKVTDLEQQLQALQSDVTARRQQAEKLQEALTSAREEASGIDQEPLQFGDLLQDQARQIAAERRRVAELEQRLDSLGSELAASRGQAARYREQIDSNQGEIARYKQQIQSNADELARYRAQLDAAQDRGRGWFARLVDRTTKNQTAVIVLAALLLLMSVFSITLLARRSLTPAPAGSRDLSAGPRMAGCSRSSPNAGGTEAGQPRTGKPVSEKPGLEERRTRSEAIAQDQSASHKDLFALAHDDIEVALPVLVKSDALTDDDLIDVIHKTTNQHRLAIAIRKGVSARVAETLVETGDAKVIAALLENPDAEIPSVVLKELARRANNISQPKAVERNLASISIDVVQGLRRPLPPGSDETAGEPEAKAAEAPRAKKQVSDAKPAAEPDKPGPATVPSPATAASPPAQTMAATEPTARQTEPASMQSETESVPGSTTASEDDPVPATPAEAIPMAGFGDKERAATGQVAPHALIEALRQGKLELFEALFGKLTGLRPPRLQQVLYGSGGEELAIACRALQLDKPLMTSIFIWSRKGRPEIGSVNPRELSNAMTVFDGISADEARDAVDTWLVAPGPPDRWNGTQHGPAAE